MRRFVVRTATAACISAIFVAAAQAADPTAKPAPPATKGGAATPAQPSTTTQAAAAPAAVTNEALMRELRCMQQRLQQLETRAQQPAAVMPVATGPGAPLIADTKPGAMPPLKAPPPVNAPRADGADPNAPLPWGSAVTKSEADPTAKSGTTTVAKGTAEAPAAGAKPLAQANPASDCGPLGAGSEGPAYLAAYLCTH